MRELSTDEKALVGLLINSETIFESKRLTVDLLFVRDAVAWVALQHIPIVRCGFNEKSGLYEVTMTKLAYQRYLNLVTKAMGFEVSLDGTVMSGDSVLGLTAGG